MVSELPLFVEEIVTVHSSLLCVYLMVSELPLFVEEIVTVHSNLLCVYLMVSELPLFVEEIVPICSFHLDMLHTSWLPEPGYL